MAEEEPGSGAPTTRPAMSVPRLGPTEGDADGWHIETQGYVVTDVVGEEWKWVRKITDPGVADDWAEFARNAINHIPGIEVHRTLKDWVNEEGDPPGGNSYTEIEGNERKIVHGECANRIFGDQWDWLFGGEYKNILGNKQELVVGAVTEEIIGGVVDVCLGGDFHMMLGLASADIVATALRFELTASAMKIEIEKGKKLQKNEKGRYKLTPVDKNIDEEYELTCGKAAITAVNDYKIHAADFAVEATKASVKAATTLDLTSTAKATLSGNPVWILGGPANEASLKLGGAQASLGAGATLTLKGGTGAVTITAAHTEIGSSMKIMHTAPKPIDVSPPKSPARLLQAQLARAGIMVTLVK